MCIRDREYTGVVYARIRVPYKLGYLFIQRHDASCHRLEVGMIRCRGSATGSIVEDVEGSESPCQFQEVIPLRQYQLRSMFCLLYTSMFIVPCFITFVFLEVLHPIVSSKPDGMRT